MKRFYLGALPVCLLLAGCPASRPPASTSSDAGTAVSTTTSPNIPAGDGKTLTIISPHTREIQVEFEQLWKKSHPDTPIKWVNQGGSSDALRFVGEQFKGRDKTQGIGVDVFFGGGGETFAELQKSGLLAPLRKGDGVPNELNRVRLRSKENTWVAAALSGFGILYNKPIAARDGLPVPRTWADLAHPKLQDRVELADPRHSGSAHVVYEIILQTNGWDKGWRILTGMAGNARRWTQGSSDALQDVQNGEATFCTAIDFYATNAITQAGADKLGYVQPQGQNLITPDPIGILVGAPNGTKAQEFVSFVLSPQAQKLWIQKKNTSGGPANNTLSRLPALPAAYGGKDSFTSVNPFKEKASIAFDADKASARRRALDDLIGVALVDNLNAVQNKWRQNPDVNASGYVPMKEAEFNALAAKWDNAGFANPQKQKWGAAARKFFGG